MSTMAYPHLPMHYLHPLPPSSSYTSQRSNHSSASASSVEPVTPELAPKTSMPIPGSISMDASGAQEDQIECKWKGCSHIATTPDGLYEHLCNVHVGRKSTNNLCLTCGWEGCGVKCVKRDHITSHLRGMSASPVRNAKAHLQCTPHSSRILVPSAARRSSDLKT
jgi:hypothetical protein